jgi:protein TonB
LVTVVPPNLPTLDAPPPPSLPADPYAPFTTSDVPGPADPGAVVTTPIRDLSYVEEPPALLRHPAPRYPEVLRQAGVEGHVVVEVVLDTSGVAEAGSLRVVTSAHQLFDAEARAVVLGSRYRPARAGGRAVRVRIQVPVVFAIRR